MRHRSLARPRLFAVVVLAATPFLLSLVVGPSAAPTWPNDWPVELEDVRADAKTIDIVTGIQATIYQIPFGSREQFEAVWPGVLRAKSPGGTLTLYKVGSEGEGWPGVSNEQPAVRIYAPSNGSIVAPDVWGREPRAQPPAPEEVQALVEQGKALEAREPWPKSAYLPSGDLSEYVTSATVDGRMTWVPAAEAEEIRFRARVDIVLVVDGEVVDLNRIHLPPDTKIIDKRGLPGSGG